MKIFNQFIVISLMIVASCKMSEVKVSVPVEDDGLTHGTLDLAYGTNGIALHDVTPGITYPYTARDVITNFKLLSDGEVIASGFGSNFASATLANADGYVLKLFNNGSLDTSFDSRGYAPIIDRQFYDRALSTLATSSAYYVVGGSRTDVLLTSAYCVLAKYSLNGSLDTSFGSSGNILTQHGGNFCYYHDIALSSSNKLIISFSYQTSSTTKYAVTSYDLNGNLDTSFGTSGVKVISSDDLAVADYNTSKIKILSDGKILIVGSRNTSSNTKATFIVRLNSNGSTDSSFGTSGVVNISYGATNYASAVDIDGDKIVIPINFKSSLVEENKAVVTRRTSTGSLDTSFGTVGYTDALSSYTTLGYEFTSIKILNGAYYIGGYVNYQASPSSPVQHQAIITALTSSGSSDPTFASSGFFSVNKTIYPQSSIYQVDGSSGALVACGDGSTNTSDMNMMCLRLE